MKIKFNDIQNVYMVLPIGYYLGRRINHKLTDGKDSYYSPEHDQIVISAPTIIDAVTSADEKNISIEEVIRGLLYHEVSHVLLTPNNFFKDYVKYKKILNIFEDERIETIFKDFYYGVNFKQNIKAINNYKGEPPMSGGELFYNVVRYRVGPSQFVARVVKIINKYKKINATYSDSYINNIGRFKDYSCYEGRLTKLKELNDYRNDIVALYNDIIKYWGCADLEKQELPDLHGNSGNSNVDPDKDSDDIVANAENIIHEAISAIVNPFYDAVLVERLNTIIANKQKQDNKNGFAINSYSGKLDVHAVANRDDYKWWCQKNRMGHIKAYSKLHFTWYIDNSGSFSANDGKINTLNQSLKKVNNSNFTYDIVTINTSIVEWPNNDRMFSSDGGNCLTDDIAKVIKKHTKSQTNNFNIVLFDGDAHSDDPYIAPYRGGSTDAFRHFDSPNTIIISDEANRKYISASVHKAKVKYTKDYCKEFIDTILELLERML